MNNTTNITDAQTAKTRYFRSKFPIMEAGLNNVVQLLADNAAVTAAAGVVSANMGNPTNITIFITAGAAVTFHVSLSPDGGTHFFQDTSLDIVFAGAGTKVVTVAGASMIKLIPTADQTGVTIITTGRY